MKPLFISEDWKLFSLRGSAEKRHLRQKRGTPPEAALGQGGPTQEGSVSDQEGGGRAECSGLGVPVPGVWIRAPQVSAAPALTSLDFAFPSYATGMIIKSTRGHCRFDKTGCTMPGAGDTQLGAVGPPEEDVSEFKGQSPWCSRSSNKTRRRGVAWAGSRSFPVGERQPGWRA